MSAESFQLSPIGFVSNGQMEMKDAAWGQMESRIILEPQYHDGLMGLEDFSHVVVVFFMHKSTFDVRQHLVRHPRERMDLPLVGTFSQRAKHRPNPIGITAVELVSVEPDGITVRGLDAIDGTPVLDIKPYVSAFDRIENSCEPEWITRLLEGYF